MKLLNYLTITLLCFYAGNLFAATKLKTDSQRFSYAVGVQISSGLKREALDIDLDALTQAIRDVMGDAKLKMTQDEIRAAIKSMQDKKVAERTKKGEAAKLAGKAFLKKNKKKDGITALVSGVQYKIIKAGKGKKPTAKDSVVAHYRGTLIDGTVFDSSYERKKPATFTVSGVIKGWQEVLPLMSVGSKWQVFIPAELAYGERGASAGIGPGETLIFDIELIEIK